MGLRKYGPAALLAAALMFAAVPAAAQVYTGRIDVTVVDASGGIVPGASVDISGPQERALVSDAEGQAHFLNLAPGTYTVTAKLSGFRDYLNRNVVVGAGVQVDLKVVMAVGTVTQEVEVSAETPVIDIKKTTTQTNISLDELQSVPSSRDPWVVMQTVPGIIVDRVNVGGAESGQQSNYQAKGAGGGENTWNVDGIAITDMAALGSSPTYYDFDMFQEMQVTTGGADVRNPTPGVQLNFMLKGGSNTPHGSARVYFENESMQSNNMPDELKGRLGGASGKGNRMDQYSDYGFEIGGPIVRDRLWAWGAIGRTDVRLLTLTGISDRTKLENYSFKATGQVLNDVRAGFTYFRGNKLKWGRGASATRPAETTYDQDGPTSLYKGETNFVVGNNLFFALRGAYTASEFTLAAKGGLDANYYVDDDGVYHGSIDTYSTDRPQWTVSGDGNFFSGHHELKYGFGWRRANVDSTDIVPGNGIVSYHVGYPLMYAEVTHGQWRVASTTGRYYSAYAGDTMTFDRLTLNVGARWDRQTASLNEASFRASPALPNLLPALTSKAVNNAIVWNSVTPRIGVNYALDEARKTILRASYGMFASQLNATTGETLSTTYYTGAYFYAIDLNGNKYADANELIIPNPDAEYLPGTGIVDWYGFDPTNPSKLATDNRVGDYKTPITHELVFGVDRELYRNLGLSASVTWRKFTRFTWQPYIGVRGDDYVQVGTFSGTQAPIGSYSVPLYGILPDRVPAVRGEEYVEREGYHQRFWGVELSATKRMADRWMARVGFSTNDHREYFKSDQSYMNRTPGPDDPYKDGGLVITQTSGSGKSGIYMVLPKYQFIVTGAYQGPWGLNFGLNMSTRQGYSEPFYRSRLPVDDPLAPSKSVLVVGVDDFRLPTLTSLDARIGKEFVIRRARLNVDVDMFNLTNANTVLGRQFDLRSGLFNEVLEIMNPRILRVGLRMNF